MLTSLAYIFLLGMLLGSVLKKIHLPRLLGYLITGIMLGPYALNMLDGSILSISTDLRRLALIIILTRAGLALDLEDLKKVGRPAILMCFVPACFEIIGVVILAPQLLSVSVLDAAVMGTVVAAVSPAVVVPKMLHLMETGYGTNKSIPQLILAGASVDDVFVIVLFTAFTGLAKGKTISAFSFAQIPVSIVKGLLTGIALGIVLCMFFKRVHLRDTAKVIILLSVSFLLIAIEHALNQYIPFSALLAVMSVGIAIQSRSISMASRLSSKFSKLWVAAEVLLFVLVGATVDINYALAAGNSAVILIFVAMIFRMAGVFVTLLNTQLNIKERLFCMVAYTPKATVQAAIGSLPLAMGLASGKIILTVAVLAILITAPFGAFGIDLLYKKCLSKTVSNPVSGNASPS